MRKNKKVGYWTCCEGTHYTKNLKTALAALAEHETLRHQGAKSLGAWVGWAYGLEARLSEEEWEEFLSEENQKKNRQVSMDKAGLIDAMEEWDRLHDPLAYRRKMQEKRLGGGN